MDKPTPRQEQVLQFIRDYTECNGYPPTFREIGRHLGISGNAGVLAHLRELERKGHIRRDQGSSRGIMLNRAEGNDLVQVPIVGTVRAGLPEVAYEDIEGYYPLERLQLKGGVFFLRVRGDSMINDAIVEGDLALVRPQETAANGDIVVAMIDGEATLKRFYRGPDHIRLQPRNPNMEPIIIPAGEGVTIVGKVIRIVREME